VVVSSSAGRPAPRRAPDPPHVIWHDLECGTYRADLPLWRELAAGARAGGQADAILDIGAGTGRVALELARAGHRVIAVDLDPELLRALRARAGAADIETVCADARTFGLERRDLALCLVPMQTVQLLGGPSGRIAFLRRARAHLRPGGLLACAIVTAFDEFDCAAGDPGPTPEIAHVDGNVYVSRARSVRVRAGSIVIERERRILAPTQPTDADTGAAERNVIALDRLDVAELEREGIEAGLTPEPARAIAATAEHVGSIVVMLRA